MLSNAYIVGEIFCDYLDDIDDVVLSNREGLNQSVEEVQTLIENLVNIRNDLMQNWGNLRSSRKIEQQDYMRIITDKQNLNDLFLKLNQNKQKWIMKIMQHAFDKESPLHQDNSTNEKIAESLMLIGIDIDLTDTATKADLNIDFQVLSKIFELLDIGTYLRLKATNQNKLKVISLLEKHIDDEAIESAFENNLYDNPWLINPSWDTSGKHTGKQKVFTSIMEYYENGEEKKLKKIGRTDIILDVIDERYPIIVELKREKKTAYSSPNVIEIISQIDKYREGIVNKKNDLCIEIEMSNKEKIQAYFICGEKAYAELEKNGNVKKLTNNNIQVVTYKKLVSNALSIFASDKDIKIFQNDTK